MTPLFLTMIVLGVVLPVLLAWIWVRRTGQPVKTILIGAGIFFAFAIVLESLPKLLFFQSGNPVGSYVMSHPWAIILVGALLAGLFEETGRFIAFRYLLRDQTHRLTSITYGIGHGGFEAMYLLAMGGIQSMAYAALIESGQFETILATVKEIEPSQYEALKAIPQQLAEASWITLCMSLLERVSAILIHVACSIMVYSAVRSTGKWWLFPLAILLHASVDIFAGLYQQGVITNVGLLELCIFAWAILFLVAVYRLVYRRM